MRGVSASTDLQCIIFIETINGIVAVARGILNHVEIRVVGTQADKVVARARIDCNLLAVAVNIIVAVAAEDVRFFAVVDDRIVTFAAVNRNVEAAAVYEVVSMTRVD